MAENQAPTPGLAQAFAMAVERGKPVEIGQLAGGGSRAYHPVAGGRFAGEGLDGRLVGGGETLLARADGVTVVEAVYYIEGAPGWTARAFGSGYRTFDGDFVGTRLTLLFETDGNGPVADLATRAFVAEQLPGAPAMTIARIV